MLKPTPDDGAVDRVTAFAARRGWARQSVWSALVIGAVATTYARGSWADGLSGIGRDGYNGGVAGTSSLIPKLSLRYTPSLAREIDAGVQWEFAAALARGNDELRHHVFVSYTYYPTSIGRAGYRVRILPWDKGDSPGFGLLLGTGVHFGGGGVGPRGEVRVVWGFSSLVGLFSSGAYEPDLHQKITHAEASFGLYFPFLF